MFSAGPFALFFVVFVAFVSALSVQHTTRDDNLPARVPYIFPPPGADAVSFPFRVLATRTTQTNFARTKVADALRSRRVNGTLLDLDGVL